MKWIRLFLMLLAFQTQVRVRADSVHSLTFWDPPSCRESKEDCRVQAGAAKLSLPVGRGQLDVARDSLLERKEGHWKLLKGTARLKKGRLECIDGSVETNGEAWILDEGGEQVVVRAIDEDLKVKMKDQKILDVPAGFEVWVGRLETNGASEHGLPKQISIADQLIRWAHLEPGEKETQIERANRLKALWKDRAEMGAELYTQVIDRQLASEQEVLRKEQQRKEALRRQRAAERQLLFSTAFEK